MTPASINEQVVTQRALWVRELTRSIRDLPLGDRNAFLQGPHHAAAAESYLRRALEALFDMGRHILAKGFAKPAAEYKEIAGGLSERGVLDPEAAELMRKMAGYRNRMVHFYHEITPEELLDICKDHLGEIEFLLERLLDWVNKEMGHPRGERPG